MTSLEDALCPICTKPLSDESICINTECPVDHVGYCPLCGSMLLKWECRNSRCLGNHLCVTEGHTSVSPMRSVSYNELQQKGSGEFAAVRKYGDLLRSALPSNADVDHDDESLFAPDESPTSQQGVSGMYCAFRSEVAPDTPRLTALRKKR